MSIKNALSQLDPQNDEHWTADGMPRIDAVSAVLGSNTTRKDITDAAPGFNRTVAADMIALAQEEAAAAAAEKPVGGDAPATDVAPEPEPEPEMAAEPEPLAEPEPEMAAEPERELTEMEKLERLLAEETEIMLEAQRVAERAKTEADAAANRVNDINRQIERMQKTDPNHGTAGIRAYLNQQNANRLRRAEGLARFVQSTGIHPQDVAKAVDPKAPIDRAMSMRRMPRGSQRPVFSR